MKELINKFKKLDQTKRIVILFITISFVFIAGFSIYNGISGNYQNGNTAQVTQVKDTKEKNTKKNKEEKQENKEDTNTQQEETTKQEENKQQESSTKKEENTTQESTTKKDDSSKQETKNTNQSSTSSSSTTESTGSTQESSNTTSNNTNTSQSPTNNKITVNVKVNGMGSIMMSGTLNVEKGATGYSVLKQLADQNGIGLSGSKIYVSGIGDLHEKQHGPMSGWMYSVNGVAPNKAACYYTLNDGDSVVWYYVNYN